MRYLAILLAVLLGTSLASAGTVTVSGVSRATTAAQDAAWATRKDIHNAQLCEDKGLPRTCTQAQLTAAGGEGTIYEGAQATQAYALDRFFEVIQAVERQINDSRKAELAAAWQTATEAQRAAAFGAACQALGKTTECR
jgi:hypothetical protein